MGQLVDQRAEPREAVRRPVRRVNENELAQGHSRRIHAWDQVGGRAQDQTGQGSPRVQTRSLEIGLWQPGPRPLPQLGLYGLRERAAIDQRSQALMRD